MDLFLERIIGWGWKLKFNGIKKGLWIDLCENYWEYSINISKFLLKEYN